MNPVNSVVSHSPLTQNDITRMPRSAADVAVAPQAAGTDTYQPTTEKKSGTLGKVLLGLAVAAAAIVGVKRFAPNWVNNVDVNNPGIMGKIKNAISWTADKIELPFLKAWEYSKKGFEWVKNLFTKKAPDAS